MTRPLSVLVEPVRIEPDRASVALAPYPPHSSDTQVALPVDDANGLIGAPAMLRPMDRRDREAAEHRLRKAKVLHVFTLAMAAQAGLTRAVIRVKVDRGVWRHVVGAAYVEQVPPTLDPVRLRAAGAALTWPKGVICLRTAALLHGMPVTDDHLAHVLVSQHHRPGRGLMPHYFPAADVRRVLSFRVTGRRATAIDCLALMPLAEAERLMAWVRTREILTVAELRRAVDEWPGRPGVAQLRRLLADTSDGALSAAERRLHQILRDAGIRGWQADQPIIVAGRIVARADVLFAEAKLIVEVDGREAHADFEAERVRLNTLSLAGYTVLRFTWHQIVDRPWFVRAQIEAALRNATR
ncbi:DUF559 domain-containing protein [Georgenia yuyongxinii]|uniref:DUF559 domain-containing protein n=1 Tax=Georgenia yuyongxinii TaxID=2589797 RepID=A0A5B8C6B8_9MICO|nr:DUF559 domain-containing protein [Georgenia yuyongxinii]QDC25938.1 DUF559 domain-containing protein [Georgenia yuyongxinii]